MKENKKVNSDPIKRKRERGISRYSGKRMKSKKKLRFLAWKN